MDVLQVNKQRFKDYFKNLVEKSTPGYWFWRSGGGMVSVRVKDKAITEPKCGSAMNDHDIVGNDHRLLAEARNMALILSFIDIEDYNFIHILDQAVKSYLQNWTIVNKVMVAANGRITVDLTKPRGFDESIFGIPIIFTYKNMNYDLDMDESEAILSDGSRVSLI